jgi:hypothetical protein
MIGRLAWRSLTAHPVRSAVLAAGFGVGVSVMAILLGVAEIVLDQAMAPALVGGGDVIVTSAEDVPARLLLTGTLQADGLRERVRVASPYERADVFLVDTSGAIPIRAKGGIPSLERALGVEETSGTAEWRDTPADRAWINDSPERMLRQADRFHPIPYAPAWASSWAEWLYFNGRSDDARFYLTFLVGPKEPGGGRSAGVRLQLERNGRMETFGATAVLTDADVERAPDLTIGASSVRLDGMTYRIHLDLGSVSSSGASSNGGSGRRAIGDLTLEASPGKLVPPIEIAGARNWVTGYVVPVMSGPLDGAIAVGDSRISLAGGTGYHDHNWGFWEGVSWQWGQVQFGELSFLFGRVFPPRDAANADRLPGFLGVVGPDGPVGYATDVRITETNDTGERPTAVNIRAIGPGVNVTLRLDIDSTESTRIGQGPLANNVDFLQLRGRYTIGGRVGSEPISGTALGSAETFRGRAGTKDEGPGTKDEGPGTK